MNANAVTILDKIVVDTRRLVAERKGSLPQSTLEAMPLFSRPTRPLAAALRGPQLSFIAEIKKASPSKGVIRADFDVADLARAYQEGGAAAVSVLTEPFYFQGDLSHLAAARVATSLPLLRKDFIVDSYQLFEARAYGADAVLLIAAVLDRKELADLHATATALGLSCLVELYDASEMDRVDLSQVQVLGVNNRDLRTFEVNIEHSIQVLTGVPDHVVRVSESGLRSVDDFARVREAGLDAVLVGETFMRASQPGNALAQLRAALAADARPARTQA